MEKISREAKVSESSKSLTSKLPVLINCSAVFSWSYAVANESDHPMVFTLDMSESNNMNFSTKGATAKKLLQPKDFWFMMHAQAGFGDFSKGIKHEVQHLPGKRK